MSSTSREKLYSPALLALATQLAAYPMRDDLTLVGEAHSRTCGSAIVCGLNIDAAGSIAEVGLRTAACAVGQAAAALFAKNARGLGQNEVESAAEQIERWISGHGRMPEWPGIDILEPAIAFPARHAAILLAWKAASEALSKAPIAS